MKRAKERASKVLTSPVSQAYLQRKANNAQANTQMTENWVVTTLVEAVERCMQKIPVLDNEGQPTGEWRFAPTQAINGLALAAKMLRLVDKPNSEGGQQIVFNLGLPEKKAEEVEEEEVEEPF